MPDDLTSRRIATTGAELACHTAGSGPPLLLLHGYPQTHAMWHRLVPTLAQRFTVICPDLRGYGDSAKPEGGPELYTKRAMAQDMADLMTALGHDRFMVAGHDRGGRVTHRLCLDHPARVERAAVLDIVPTRTVFQATDQALAMGYYHWFFLSQPAPLPERLIGADPLFYLHHALARWSATQDLTPFTPEALAAYERAFADPATIHATCNDYRAAATLDLDHDGADQHHRIACPLLVLWGEHGLMHRTFDVLATWQKKASGPVTGHPIASGHFLPEENPDDTLKALLDFFC